MPGSPASLVHSIPVRIAYACVAVLIGLTGGLGAGLLAANLPAIAGQLSLTSMQATWLPAAYVMVSVTANLLVYKFRQQYGIRLFAELGLGMYAALAWVLSPSLMDAGDWRTLYLFEGGWRCVRWPPWWCSSCQ